MGLEAVVDELLERHGVPGAVVGVLDGAGGAEVVATGTRGEGRGPVAEDTVFAAASLTKPVVAASALALVEAGVLELDRPVVSYGVAPAVADDERASAITARTLLAHTSGLLNWREDGPLVLRWAPGDRWGYSGEGYAHLRQVIEHVAGVGLEDHLAATVLGPLGMADSHLHLRPEDEARVAVGHDHHGRPQPHVRRPPGKAAAGGLHTTAADYLRFLADVLAGPPGQDAPPVRIDDGLAWGLGWGIEEAGGERALWQWGDNPGYKAFAIGRPADGRGVVVLTNGERGAGVGHALVRRLLPGPHPSLETRRRPRWLRGIAVRPVDLRPRLDDPAVRALLGALAWRGEEGEVDRIADRYRSDGADLLGVVVPASWESRDAAVGTPIAVIGLERRPGDEAEITALAVAPEWRGRGIAGRLVFGAGERLGLGAVEAETDADAVDAYRTIGFAVESLGERYPGVERFRCRLDLAEL